MAPALILALHARFEANASEYARIETARVEDDDFGRLGQLSRATGASEAEEDALRHAILTQVPASSEDALVLMFHIRLEQDFQAHSVKTPSDAAKALLRTAIDTLFDFMACQSQFDHGEIGRQLQEACNTVFYARRHRTGEMEG